MLRFQALEVPVVGPALRTQASLMRGWGINQPLILERFEENMSRTPLDTGGGNVRERATLVISKPNQCSGLIEGEK